MIYPPFLYITVDYEVFLFQYIHWITLHVKILRYYTNKLPYSILANWLHCKQPQCLPASCKLTYQYHYPYHNTLQYTILNTTLLVVSYAWQKIAVFSILPLGAKLRLDFLTVFLLKWAEYSSPQEYYSGGQNLYLFVCVTIGINKGAAVGLDT